MRGDGVGVVTAERLFDAIVGIFHYIGHCQNGVPRRVNGKFKGIRMISQRLAPIIQQSCKLKRPGLIAADRQWEAFRHKHTVGKYRYDALFLVAEQNFLKTIQIHL